MYRAFNCLRIFFKENISKDNSFKYTFHFYTDIFIMEYENIQ